MTVGRIAERVKQGAARGYVIVYSGPEPPSGVVRRPPFAVIAPHCEHACSVRAPGDHDALAGRRRV
jgi:hypothetical protein